MSQIVTIDYEHIACQCNTVCNLATHALNDLDNMLKEIESVSTRLLNDQTENFKTAINKEKENLINKIENIKRKVNEDAKQGSVTLSNHDPNYTNYIHRNDIIYAANDLKNDIDAISSKRIFEFKSLLHNLLKESANEAYRKLLNSNGVVTIDSRIQRTLDSISDNTLRQFTYLAYLKDHSLTGDDLVKAGKTLMEESLNNTYESNLAKEEERIRKELEEAKVEKNLIEEVVSKEGNAKDRIVQMQSLATKEIINESIRTQSLKAIMKAIRTRGFIIDKENIKINKATNEVHMVAMKASGERADFKVYLDGKFTYDFHTGYKGQACQKDIEPFLKDLEEVYGFHIKKCEEIWSNPDKISTMKYQTMNSNKNRG